MRTLLLFIFLVSGCGTATKESRTSTTAVSPAVTTTTTPGPEGPVGPQGPTGKPGPQGVAGPAAVSVGCFLEVNDEYLGLAVNGCSEIMFSDGVVAIFSNGDSNGCLFTTTDCTGSCYDIASGPKNLALYGAATGWWKIIGDETPVPNTVIQSAVGVTDTCVATSETISAIALTAWTPPVTLALPIGEMYVGEAP